MGEGVDVDVEMIDEVFHTSWRTSGIQVECLARCSSRLLREDAMVIEY